MFSQIKSDFLILIDLILLKPLNCRNVKCALTTKPKLPAAQ